MHDVLLAMGSLILLGCGIYLMIHYANRLGEFHRIFWALLFILGGVGLLVYSSDHPSRCNMWNRC